MIAKLDRLSRGVIESAVIEELVSRKHARILSAGGEGTERNDPTAHLTRRMLQLVASYERSLIAARTKAALAAKKARGEKIGAEPYSQNDTEKAIVATIADCRTVGFSFEATAAEQGQALNRETGGTIEAAGQRVPQRPPGITSIARGLS